MRFGHCQTTRYLPCVRSPQTVTDAQPCPATKRKFPCGSILVTHGGFGHRSYPPGIFVIITHHAHVGRSGVFKLQMAEVACRHQRRQTWRSGVRECNVSLREISFSRSLDQAEAGRVLRPDRMFDRLCPHFPLETIATKSNSEPNFSPNLGQMGSSRVSHRITKPVKF